MIPLYTAQEMRELDRITIQEIGVPGVVLMEHAGYKSALILADIIEDEDAEIAVVCGKGNNGGDGYVIARWLSHWGWRVNVFSLCPKEELKGDAKVNAEIFTSLYPDRFEVVEPDEEFEMLLSQHQVVVDAIFGTGLTRPAEGKYKAAIEAINHSTAFVFSVDIPSGLPSDSGRVIGPTVYADVTATYGGLKRAHMIYPAKEYVGDVYLVDIGIPFAATDEVYPGCFLVEEEDAMLAAPLFRLPTAHKGDFGHVAIICGSPGKTGAGIMAGQAALKMGVGLVTLFVPEELNPIYESSTLEVMSLPLPSVDGHLSSKALDTILAELENKDAVAIGPGLGQHPETLKLLKKLIKEIDLPMVIDADGINLIAKDLKMLEKAKAPIILTPHPGEFSRLTGVPTEEINAKRLEVAVEWAKKLGVIIVLKGASTITALPTGTAFVNPTGNPGMATGGSGDVLTGIIAALMGVGRDPAKAAACGAFIHGLAGDLMAEKVGQAPLVAGDIIRGVAELLKAWEKGERVWERCYEAL